MEKITLQVDLDAVYKRLFKESSYVARSRSAMGLSDQLADSITLTGDERPVIEKWITSCVNEIVHSMNRYLGPCSATHRRTGENDAGQYTISVIAPHNYPDGLAMPIKECIIDFIFYNTMQHWYTIIKPDEANIMAVHLQESAARLRELLTHRKRPAKGYGKNENVIEL